MKAQKRLRDIVAKHDRHEGSSIESERKDRMTAACVEYAECNEVKLAHWRLLLKTLVETEKLYAIQTAKHGRTFIHTVKAEGQWSEFAIMSMAEDLNLMSAPA